MFTIKIVDLEPCPFCGSENIVLLENNLPLYHTWAVICTDCKCGTDWIEDRNFEGKEAIEKWNRRVQVNSHYKSIIHRRYGFRGVGK